MQHQPHLASFFSACTTRVCLALTLFRTLLDLTRMGQSAEATWNTRGARCMMITPGTLVNRLMSAPLLWPRWLAMGPDDVSQITEIRFVPDPTCQSNQIETPNEPFGNFPLRFGVVLVSGASCIRILNDGSGISSTFDSPPVKHLQVWAHALPLPLRPRRPTPARARLPYPLSKHTTCLPVPGVRRILARRPSAHPLIRV